jgi:hypothetical protein
MELILTGQKTEPAHLKAEHRKQSFLKGRSFLKSRPVLKKRGLENRCTIPDRP